ncbi:transglycosylase domain-containing protein [Egicoccus sp. AB-alg2]|uniref:transglycosylase domain-containing protein n=1 Tax=Egicoccus sp. AB-alg2 TaxID=3242693 RepID=UPI00359EEA2A
MALLALLAVAVTGCGEIVTLELPTAEGLSLTRPQLPEKSVVYDAHGNELAVLRTEFRETATLAELPQHLVDAVLVAEDGRFYEHRGVDARAILRAAIANHEVGHAQQGGSTITQQLVKLQLMPSAERTGATKLQEAVYARELEGRRSKAAILEDYLNSVYFGAGAHGVKAAAWTYFRREPAELDLAQSALLAAIIRAPEAFAPTRAPEAARTRRDDVLRRMASAGYVTEAARDEALAAPVEVLDRPPAPTTDEPHFVDLVVRTLLEDPSFGASEADRAARLHGGGLRVHTTLDPDVQEIARETLARHLPDPDGPEAAIAVVDPGSGAVLAAVGSRPYDELQYDLATQARRQPGSTFKTFVLATALADGWRPDDLVDGRQGTLDTPEGGWEVRNYDRHSYGDITLAGATRASINAAYARLGMEVGVGRVAGTARAMGVRSEVPVDDPQITLGGGRVEVTPLDLAAAYGTLANGGTHVPTSPIHRIEDRDGRTVWRPEQTPRPVLSSYVADQASRVLQEAVDNGTGLAARVAGWDVAGKTGTTSDNADAWFVGYTPTLSAAVWVGHVEGRVPLRNVNGVREVTGGTLPARMFSETLTAALAGQEPPPRRRDAAPTAEVRTDSAAERAVDAAVAAERETRTDG